MAGPRQPATRRAGIGARLREEGGAIAVLFAFLLIILFAAVAFAVDLSRLYHQKQVLQNAVDFGALAGAQDLPVQGSAEAAVAATNALNVTLDNTPGLTASQVSINFRCLVGDRNDDGIPDPEDIPSVCGPASGTWPASEWRTRRGHSSHACNPYAGDKCNTIVVSSSRIVNYVFAPVIGIDRGSTGALNAASCRGACGAASAPLDVVMVLDRTGSMTPADIANVKNAALAVLDFYDASQQWVGLVSLPYGQPSNKCQVNSPQAYPQSAASYWQNVPLSSDYDLPDGTPNPASALVQGINCLVRAGSPKVTVNGVDKTSNGHTNLGDPLDAAREMLLKQGRPDVPDVLIFMTDGEANQPAGMNPCQYLNTKATQAKNAGQTVYTIGYGVEAAKCNGDTSGFFKGRFASTNLALAATNSTDDVPGGCGPNENTDGDDYFCESGSGDLEPVFRQVAAAAIGNARLVDDT
jgi:Putative Flp pilus-assembly TadE/G-like/von Willebrand factor type A domain